MRPDQADELPRACTFNLSGLPGGGEYDEKMVRMGPFRLYSLLEEYADCPPAYPLTARQTVE